MTCIFCRIVLGEELASRVYETETVLALMNLRQFNAGHVLVIPKEHVATVYDLAPELAGELMQATVVVANKLRRAFDPAGLSLWQSNGDPAGQEIPHVHIHLLPRYEGDDALDFYPAGNPPIQPRTYLDQLATQIKSA